MGRNTRGLRKKIAGWNTHIPMTKPSHTRGIMSLCHYRNILILLLKLRPAIAGPTARIRQPYGPQPATGEPAVGNEVLHQAFLYYTCAKTTKPTGNSHIKTQGLRCSATENRGF